MQPATKPIIALTFSLALALALIVSFGLGVKALAADGTPAPTPASPVDPPLPLFPPPTGFVAQAEGVNAILELAWSAPQADSTNSLSWGDYNLDGDLDLLVGNNGDNRIYENIGGALTQTLALRCETGLADNTYGVEWFDYDQDGDLDFAVGNLDGRNCVFRYDQSAGTFTRAWLANIVQNTRAVAWAGWSDDDGEFTTYMGVGNSDEPSVIYRYEAGLIQAWWTQPQGEYGTTNSLAWGDYDNDGDPDLAIGNFGQGAQLYRNDLATLTLVTTTQAMYTRDVAWGDMNGDGTLDLALGNGHTTGRTDADQVYCNQGAPDYGLSLCWTSDDLSPTYSIAWGDYDGDADLDLAASSESGGQTRIYFNEAGMLDTSAGWNANDDALISRAVAWADWDGDGDLELSVGYYGSNNVLYNNTNGAIFSSPVGESNLDSRSVAWGDWDGDSDLDLAVGNSSNTPSQVYANTGEGFSLAWSAPFAENTRSLAWGDFDGDGDLDLAAGSGQNNGGFTNRVYINQSGTLLPYWNFIDAFPANTYSVAWGDYDGDQDLDLAAGNYETNQPNTIYINRDGVFTETLALTPASDRTLSLAWADFDQDYDLDLATANSNGPDRVYINDGAGNFTSQALPVPAAPCTDDTRSIAWADWDGDGDLDLATGNAGVSGCVQIVTASQFGGAWIFSSAWQSTSRDVRSVDWGDYDGDGDYDLAVGVGGQFGGRSRIYRNMGGSLTEFWLAAASETDPAGEIAWGDYDADGDLDLALATELNPATPVRVYTNNWQSAANRANDPLKVKLHRPDATADAAYFASTQIVGDPVIGLWYTLYDDEYDRAFMIEPQVSWDGGGHWEAAWDAGMGEGVTDLSASPQGDWHVFAWDALHQLLDHQGIPFDPGAGEYVPFPQSDEEMDVVFRIVAWSNNDHGGPIQHPVFGSSSNQVRVDMRPDWTLSAKSTALPYAVPGQQIDLTIAITQTDHGMPPEAYVLDYLPPELAIGEHDGVYANTGEITWTQNRISWTGALQYQGELWLRMAPWVTRPLTNGLEIENCAEIYDGLHEPFDLCASFAISSTPTLTESWKLVNGLAANTAYPGDILTYTIVLTNTGTDNAYSAWMTDVLDANLVWLDQIVASSGQADYQYGAISWRGDINVFEPVMITFTAQVTTPLPGSTVITNTFWLSDGIHTAFFAAPVTTTVLAPELAASSKTGNPLRVELGQPLTYTIVLTNNGALDADPAVFYDPIPEGSAYLAQTFQASQGVGGYDPFTEAITWTGTVAVGEPVTLSFAIAAGLPGESHAPANATLTNTAVISDPIGGPITLVATNTVWLPDFAGSWKSAAPDSVALGERITYTLVVSNSGGVGPDIRLEDPIPANAAYVPDSFSASQGGWIFDPDSEQIEWWSEVASGQSVTMTFAITAGCPVSPAVPYVFNQASLFIVLNQETGASLPSSLSAQTLVNLPDLSSSQITANKALVESGGLLQYTIVVQNTGGLAPSAWLEDYLPSDATWTGNYSVSQGSVTYSSVQHRMRWEGTIYPGQTIFISFEVLVSEAPYSVNLLNQATLSDGCRSLLLGPVMTAIDFFRIFLPMAMR